MVLKLVQKWTTILLFAYYRNFVKLGRFLANTRNKILRQSQGRDANTTPLPLVLLISGKLFSLPSFNYAHEKKEV